VGFGALKPTKPPTTLPVKKFLIIVLIAVATTIGAADLPVEVHFSPHGGCTEAVVRELNKAHSTIYMQAYSFTSKPIAEAMVNARKRGVKVQAIVDKSQRKEQYTEADFLAHSGITTYIDAQHAIAHNKIMIIDERVVITGSFNFTTAAEKSNAENLLVITDKATAGKYLHNWQEHQKHSEPYAGR
jgi:phosphatidylserine/phosphatidylglycerophosphate/cardiolipin synthase-like enzyme